MLTKFCLTVVFLFAVVPPLHSDQVRLSNGDRVSGKIVSKDGDTLKVKTDLMGEVSIPWKSVESVSTDDPLTVVLTAGTPLYGKLNIEEKKVEVATISSTRSAPVSDLVAIRDKETQEQHERLENPGLLDLWEGYVDVGLSGARGNARTNVFTTAAIATRTTRTDKTVGYFNSIYSSALVEGTSATTAQALRGGWSYNRNVHPKLFLNLFNDYEYDRFQNLDLRFVLGGGLGYIAIKDDRKRLDLLGGVAYNREEFNTPEIRNSAEGYWGDDFNYNLSKITQFQQRFRMFHNLSDPGPYRVNFDLSFVTQLTRWLSWQLSLSDRFLSNPVPGRQRNDVLYTTGLRLKFAR